MPINQNSNTIEDPSMQGTDAVPQNPKARAGQVQMQPVTPTVTPETVLYLMQQATEQVKFEIKKEFSTALTAKANALRTIDPATATALQAVAISIAEAMSEVMPIGGNQEFNAQQMQMQSQQQMQMQPQQMQGQVVEQAQPKTAADVDDFVFQTMMSILEQNNWLAENQGIPQEKLAEDLSDTFTNLKHGLERFQEDYEIDFTDRNTWDLLSDLIIDGTLLSYSE